jgi:uncharacterized short protein YbdD (DUF466 family)
MSVAATPTSQYLPIYLNDHLGGSTVGVELVQRVANGHRGTELGTFAEGLAPEIKADRDALLEIMDLLGASKDQAKVAMGWITEKFGRLKPNGELREPSPLSPLIELEGLSLGIEGKRSLWVALASVDAVAMSLREAVSGVRWYLREVSGESAYDRYVEHVRRDHPDQPVMSRRDFERRRMRMRDENPKARCC